MHVPVEYVVGIVTALAGAIGVLFRLYVKAQEARIKERAEHNAILEELHHRLTEGRKKS